MLRTFRCFAAALLICSLTICGSSLALAQAPAAPAAQAAPAAAAADKNPVTSIVRRMFENRQRNIVAAAEQMPAEKYGYHPTEGQMTYGEVMAHVATSNGFLCSRIGDAAAPESLQVKAEDGKDKIVAAVKASMDFCRDALGKLDDSKLGDQVTFRGGNKVARAAAVVELPVDLADHYAAAAGYLRLNGMLPPSAQPRR